MLLSPPAGGCSACSCGSSCDARASSTVMPWYAASLMASFRSISSWCAKCSRSSGWLYDSSVCVSGVEWNSSGEEFENHKSAQHTIGPDLRGGGRTRSRCRSGVPPPRCCQSSVSRRDQPPQTPPGRSYCRGSGRAASVPCRKHGRPSACAPRRPKTKQTTVRLVHGNVSRRAPAFDFFWE